MNQRLYAEFTALVATQAPLVVEGAHPLVDGPLWIYWQHSQAMLRRWRKSVEADSEIVDQAANHRIMATVSSILVSEMLTRVWGAILAASDAHRQQRHSAPIARSVLTAHLQCRVNVFQMLVHSNSFPMEQLSELDRLRRRVERWTDLLLGPLVTRYGESVAEFAFDERRATDFGHEQFQTHFHSASRPAWSFLLVGLRTAFPEGTDSPTTNDATLPILRSVLTMFPSDAFQNEGPIKSIRWARASRSGQLREGPPVLATKGTRILRADELAHSRPEPVSVRRRTQH